MTLELSIEQQIILYECLQETAHIIEFDFETIERAFFCGERNKFRIPNTLLIIVPEDIHNRFFEEMSCETGARGGAYLTQATKHGKSIWLPENRKYHCHYKIITNRVFNNIYPDWKRLADDSWSFDNNAFMPGLELDIKKLKKYYGLRVLL